MGLAPMSGFREGEEAGAEERAVQYFLQRSNFLFSYSGLAEYKAKFATHWEPRYAVYRNVLDLPRLAVALVRVSGLKDRSGGPCLSQRSGGSCDGRPPTSSPPRAFSGSSMTSQWAKLLTNITGLDWRWVALGVLVDVVSYAVQGAPLAPPAQAARRHLRAAATQAVYAGLFFNEVVPFHLGEIARAYPVSRWMAAPLVAVVPSMALERLFDGIWLAAGIGITAIFVPLPRNLLQAGDLFGLAILALTAVLLYLLVRKAREPRPERPGKLRRWRPTAGSSSISGSSKTGFGRSASPVCRRPPSRCPS